jgi:lytic murein transglycosylase
MRGIILAGSLLACALGAIACAPHSAAQQPPQFAASGDAAFDAWREDFARRAIAQGRNPDIVRRMLSGLTSEPRVIQNDRNQAEFVRPVWDYITRAASAQRISEGSVRRAEHNTILNQVQDRFGVDADIIIGVWGMETNYGVAPLPYDAAQAIATLAAEGRRRAQFETYFLALIEMVERGYAEPGALRSSWAGALGQPQFMPDVYLSTAVDWNGDGRRDIWNDNADVFASIANYFASRGWRRGEPVFEEVRLPSGFDYALADGTQRTVAEWQRLGIALAAPGNITPAQTGLNASLFLPAGAEGPAILLFANFGVIRAYNPSDRYALAVALIARGVEGRGGLSQAWPTHLGALQRDQILELQTALIALGYPAGTPDGMFGSNTRRAVREYQKAQGLPADGFPTMTLLQRIRDQRTGQDRAAAQNAAQDLDKDGVKALQTALIRLGHLRGTADGKVGSRTRAAIEAFERKIGLAVTGRATDYILAEAKRAVSQSPPPRPARRRR